jgi:hypothetical protein
MVTLPPDVTGSQQTQQNFTYIPWTGGQIWNDPLPALPNFSVISNSGGGVVLTAAVPTSFPVSSSPVTSTLVGMLISPALAGTQNQVGAGVQWVGTPATKKTIMTWVYDSSRSPGAHLTSETVTVPSEISTMSIDVNGVNKTIYAYADVDKDGTSDPFNGLFQCTSLVSQYLAALGFVIAPPSIGDGKGVAYWLSSKDAEYFQYSDSGLNPPAVGSIISMNAGTGGVPDKTGHVAIVKGETQPDANTIVVTLIEDNMTFDHGATYAVDRTMTFTKGKNGQWVSHYTTPAGNSYDVVDWVTPTKLP